MEVEGNQSPLNTAAAEFGWRAEDGGEHERMLDSRKSFVDGGWGVFDFYSILNKTNKKF